jgi:acyl carrier protein
MGDGMDTKLRGSILSLLRIEIAPDRNDVDLEEDSLLESGLIDSLGIIKLVSLLEKEFAIKISDDELLPENFETISAVVQFVVQKQKSGAREK